MFASVLFVAVAVMGIDAGWQPLPDGGTEYIIQIDSPTLEALKAGQPIGSDIHPDAREIKSYKIVIGTGKLPRENPVVKPAEKLLSNTDKQPPNNPAPTQNSSPDQTSKQPQRLEFDQSTKPLSAQPANFIEMNEKASADKKEEPAKPWLVLTGVSLAFFASLGGNIYLVWLFADLRRRYKTAISK